MTRAQLIQVLLEKLAPQTSVAPLTRAQLEAMTNEQLIALAHQLSE